MFCPHHPHERCEALPLTKIQSCLLPWKQGGLVWLGVWDRGAGSGRAYNQSACQPKTLWVAEAVAAAAAAALLVC